MAGNLEERKTQDETLYNVMPRGSGSSPIIPQTSSGTNDGSKSKKWLYVMLGVIALFVLFGVAYYMLGFKDSETADTEELALPRAWLSTHFNSDTCNNESVCGLNADPEKDGLGNHDEFKAGTNPLNPDTDQDGLADGDEVNIFKTDPILKYTDRREEVARLDWSDGIQFKNGYDPLTPGQKLSDIRIQQIEQDSRKFNFHEPTITTLSSVSQEEENL